MKKGLKKSLSMLLAALIAFSTFACGIAAYADTEVTVSSWSQLQAEIDSASAAKTITLDGDITATDSDSTIIVSESKEITIALNNYTINRNKADTENGGVIRNYGTLTILGDYMNLGTIKGGYTEKEGAGIYNEGTLKLESVEILSNVSLSNGGGIYNAEGATLTAQMTTVSNNTASGKGGGVCNYGTFSAQEAFQALNNTSGDKGGAFYENGTFNAGGYLRINSNTGGDGYNADNLYLEKDKVIHLTDSISTDSNLINVSLYESNSKLTSGYSNYNGSVDPNTLFACSVSGSAATLEVKNSEVIISGIYYIDRYWDEEADKLVTQAKRVGDAIKFSEISWSPVGRFGSGWYILDENYTLDDRMEINGDVHLVLLDGCTLKANKGIMVNTGNTLSIYAGGNETGKIVATGSESSGIGSCQGNGGTINFVGGNITASADFGNAAIGLDNNFSSITMNFYGGTINATAGYNAAAIGTGQNEAVGNSVYMNFYGGNITARSFPRVYSFDNFCMPSAIGGGEAGYGGHVVIKGGTIYADSNASSCAHHAAPISGGGYLGDAGSTLEIADGMKVSTDTAQSAANRVLACHLVNNAHVTVSECPHDSPTATNYLIEEDTHTQYCPYCNLLAENRKEAHTYNEDGVCSVCQSGKCKINLINELGTTSELVKKDSEYTLPAGDNYDLDGKHRKFLGWKLNNEGELLPAGDTITADTQKNLYAQMIDAYAINLPEETAGGRVSADMPLAYDGETVTLTCELNNGYVIDTLTVDGNAVTPEDNKYSFVMPAHDVNVEITYYQLSYTVTWVNFDGEVLKTDELHYGDMPVYSGETPIYQTTGDETATFKEWYPAVAAVTGDITYRAQFDIKKTVPYIDANGVEQTVRATVLTGLETGTLAPGWYVADTDIAYNHSLQYYGEFNLILADDTEIRIRQNDNYDEVGWSENNSFTIDTSVENHNDSVLNVFRQKNGTGKFSVGVLGANLNMYGGNLDLVLATLQETYFHGGNFAAKLGLIMNIVFDLTAATDSVLFGERCVLIGTASVAEGKTIKDQDENLYTGELGKLTIENKTFTPYIAQPEKTAQDKYNLTVQENIDVNVLIDVRGHANDGEEIEKIVYTYPDITTQEKKTVTEKVNAADITTDATGYFAKSFTMAIAQANEPIVATLYFTNGTTKDITVSVAAYCDYIIKNATANGYSNELVNLCYAVLDYGKNAADYFHYEYEAYPQYTLPDYFAAEPEITSQAGIHKGSVVTKIDATQMFILSKATMRLTFKDDLSALTVGVPTIDGETRPGLSAEIVENNGKYSVDISGIYATELSKPITIELSDETKVQYAATDWVKSILAYSTSDSSKALARSLYYYSKAANDYFA